MKLSVTKDGLIKYSNVRIENSPNSKFPTLVQIVKVPSKLKLLLGKKYITLEKAILAIDEINAFGMIEKEKLNAKLEMGEMGIVSIIEL